MTEKIGTFNKSADNVERVDATWSDTNLTKDFNTEQPSYVYKKFPRLVCNYCKRTLFEILQTGDYQTTARCICGKYYIVHSG